MTRATGGVAAGLTLPVEVLMKSAPASSASTDARRTLSSVTSSPVSRMTFRCAVPQAALRRDDLVEHLPVAAGQEGAPVDHHVDLVGAGGHRVRDVGQLDVASDARPDGNAVATLATCTADAAQRLDRDLDEVGIHAHGGDRRRRRIAGSGRMAFAHSERTLPGVSAPSSVVRSTMRIGGLERPGLARRLDAARGQRGRTGLGADLVDARQSVQETPQRRLVPGCLAEHRDVAAEGPAESGAHGHQSKPFSPHAGDDHPNGR